MSDPKTSPINQEALDEFIRQLFACNWVLGRMIEVLLERARSEPPDAEPMDTCAYSMIRRAIGEVVDRHGAQQIEATTTLIDEVIGAISDDRHIFPPDPAMTTLYPDRDSPRRRARKRGR